MTQKIIIIFISLFFYISISPIASIAFAEPNEEKAIEELAQKMLAESNKLKGKRIGLFKFASMEGKETPEGARVSDYLLEKLIADSSLSFIDRSELHKIIAENELGQTGLIDSSLANESGKILPIDLMITGTFAQISTEVNISARVVDAKTGKLHMIKSCRYNSIKTVNKNDSPEAIALYKKSPDELDRLNRAFFNLQIMSKNAPLIFLITVLDKSEIENLEKNQPRIANSLKKRKEKLDKENPDKIKKIQDLRKSLNFMKVSFPKRYDIIMAKKNEVINSRPGKK